MEFPKKTLVINDKLDGIETALGKAAPDLTQAWLELLPGWADDVLVLAPHSVPVADRVAETDR